MTGEGWVTSSSSRGQALRGNNGRDGRFANRAYGLLTTRASAAWGQSIFIAITGEGAHEGRPYGGWGRFVSGRADVGRKGEGWVPACTRTTEGDGMDSRPPSWRGKALGGNNGRGGAVREPPLREKERVRGERFLDAASLRSE